MADAAYAAGLALMGASRFTVPRPFLREHVHFLLGHAHFRCLANLDLQVLLPPSRQLELRNRGHEYELPRVRTERFKRVFVNRCLFNFI